MKKIGCVYYPYSRPKKFSTLKKAALLFDKVSFLDGQPTFIRKEVAIIEANNHQEDQREVDIVYSAIEKLEEEGIAQTLDAAVVAESLGEYLTENVVYDVSDNEFCKMAMEEDVSTWRIQGSRLPKGFVGAFYPGAGRFSEAISLQSLIKSKGNLDNVNESIKSFAEFRWKNLPKDRHIEVFLSSFRYVIGGNPHAKHIELEAYQVPHLQAASLRINEALLVSAAQGLVPFTDSTHHDRLLRRKVARTLGDASTDGTLKKVIDGLESQKDLEAHLTLFLVDKVVSPERLAEMSIDEILRYRNKFEKARSRLRERVEEIAYSLREHVYSEKLPDQLDRIINEKVHPVLLSAREEMQSNFEEAVGKVSAHTIAAMLSFLAATHFNGMDAWQILAAGAAAGGALISTKGVDDLLELWKSNRKVQRHGFSYLTSL